MSKIIVITGGPSSGKTSLINTLALEGMVCYPEISREITLKARLQGVDQFFLDDPFLFSQKLLEGRYQQFLDAQLEDSDLVFLDRGLPDVVAYLDYTGAECPIDFLEVCGKSRYDLIFILPPWELIYKQDDVRYERFDQACLIDASLWKTYNEMGYEPILVPKVSVSNRFKFVMENIRDL